jgi:spore germination cell wall hydrolase CwlJ-like protein
MVASRVRTMGASYSAPFWFSAVCLALMPTSIGYQDLAALVAQQPGVSQRWREHLIASPFGTIESATFSYGRPIGTSMPEPLGYQTVNFDPRSLDANNWQIDGPLTARTTPIEYPTVNRRLKGDRLPVINITPDSSAAESLPQLQPNDAPAAAKPWQPLPPPPAPALPLKNTEQDDIVPPIAHPAQLPPSAPVLLLRDTEQHGAQLHTMLPPASDSARGPVADDDIALVDKPPEIPAAAESYSPDGQASSLASLSFFDDDAAETSAQTFFGVGVMGAPSGLENWAPGAGPVLVSPSVESGIKLSALEGAAAAADAADADNGGETVAKKDDGSLLESPAERLKLAGTPRARAEKCIADAVYFEARGEPLKGQEAVAQVVMNRVFSGYYPNDVCGVVYQNANRHLACQFTFACEGRDLNRVDEPDMWQQAKRIAKDTLDGKIWLTAVGHATHYHAYWVHPSWVHEMTKLYKLGVHTFYRPRNWGDGDDEPSWGKAPNTSKADTPADKAEAVATPAPAAAKSEPTAKL